MFISSISTGKHFDTKSLTIFALMLIWKPLMTAMYIAPLSDIKISKFWPSGNQDHFSVALLVTKVVHPCYLHIYTYI